MRSHTQEKLVACPTCGSMFSSNTKLFDHLHRQAEPNGKKGKLVFCSQQFFGVFFLNKSLTFAYFFHPESLVCEHCGKAFSNERLLRDHVRQHGNAHLSQSLICTSINFALAAFPFPLELCKT